LYLTSALQGVLAKAKVQEQQLNVATLVGTQAGHALQEHKALQALVVVSAVATVKVATATVATVDESRLQTPHSPTA
jgi:GAF domain-containing protein